MARSKKDKMSNKNGNGANLRNKQTLCVTADQMRGHMNSAEYRYIVLWLILIKHISDVFQELCDDLAQRQKTNYTDPEDRNEYLGLNIFWVLKESRWSYIQQNSIILPKLLSSRSASRMLKGLWRKQYD